MSLGQAIATVRKQKNLKQADVGELIGVNQSVVARWENDQARPRKQNLIDLAAALDVSLESLLVQDASRAVKDLRGANPDLADLLQQIPKLAEDQLAALKVVVRDMLTRSQLEGVLRAS